MTDERPAQPLPDRTSVVTLRPVTPSNVDDVLALRVGPEQEQFVANNARSLAQGSVHPYAWRRAIYAGETPVGYVMLVDDPHAPAYYLWRLMVDHRYQRCGFGGRAMEQVIEYVLGRPGATELLTSYVPAEGSPFPFYTRLGFVETGEVDDGERVMRLDLAGRSRAAVPTPRPLTHVVLFKLKETEEPIAEETAASLVTRLRSLDGQIPELQQIEVGRDVRHSGRSYDVALITRFAGMAEMEAYQVNPAHVAVLEYIRTVVAALVVVDVEME